MKIKYITALLLFFIIGFTACKKNGKVSQPIDIDFSQNFIDDSQANSFWQYVSTQNGDTLTSSPAKIFKLPNDSIIKGNPYKVYALINEDGSTIPIYLFRYVLNTIYEPRFFNGDSTQILEVPIVDFNRNLFESWQVETSTVFKQVFMIDSLNFMFKEHQNVFRISSENYWQDNLISNSTFYYSAETGLLYRNVTDAINNAELIFELEDYDVKY